MSSSSSLQNVSTDTSEISRGPRIAFLFIFMAMTSVGCTFIFVAIIQHRKHKTAQNVIIANISILCIIDCFLNMSLVLGALITDEWVYGDFVCKLNTSLMNFVASELVLLLMSLSIDRYLALKYYTKYEPLLQPYKLCIVFSLMWIHALAFNIPFLTNIVTSTFHHQLHLCSATSDTSSVFLYITLLACFFLPFIVTIVFHVLVIHLSCKLRVNKRAKDSVKTYTQVGNESVCSSGTVSHPSCYTRILFILWLVLVLPSIITSYVKHFGNEDQFENFPWIADAVFLWLRFFFPAIFPLVTFYCKKELWQTTKECILCRRNNSVVDMEVNGVNSVTSLKQDKEHSSADELPFPKLKEKDKEKEKTEPTPNVLSFNVPVLFATSTGICIEDPSLDDSHEPHFISEDDTLRIFKGKKLDISYEQEWHEDLMGDTSDYDSSFEVDQYSTSQPVSTRNVQGTLHRTRSLSDPEITKYVSPRKTGGNAKVVYGTSRTDSGLDLTGTGGSGSAARIARAKGVESGQSSNDKDIQKSTVALENLKNSEYSNSCANIVISGNTTTTELSSDNSDLKIENVSPPERGKQNVNENSKLRDKSLPPRLTPILSKEPVNKTRRKKSKIKTANDVESKSSLKQASVDTEVPRNHLPQPTKVEQISTRQKPEKPYRRGKGIDPK